jgi:hypothetical protein
MGLTARARRSMPGRTGERCGSPIRPGKPIENAYVESFNGRFRDECLNEHWFLRMQHARTARSTIGHLRNSWTLTLPKMTSEA